MLDVHSRNIYQTHCCQALNQNLTSNRAPITARTSLNRLKSERIQFGKRIQIFLGLWYRWVSFTPVLKKSIIYKRRKPREPGKFQGFVIEELKLSLLVPFTISHLAALSSSILSRQEARSVS